VQTPQQPAQGPAAAQDPAAVPEGWTAIEDPAGRPRGKGLRKNTAGLATNEQFACMWMNPAAPGDTIALTVGSPTNAYTAEFTLEGVDMAVLHVDLFRSHGRRSYSLCYLPTAGSYSIYPPECLDNGFGFQVTPSKQLPGLFDVQVKWIAKGTLPAAPREK
jgi:hypothetical protein